MADFIRLKRVKWRLLMCHLKPHLLCVFMGRDNLARADDLILIQQKGFETSYLIDYKTHCKQTNIIGYLSLYSTIVMWCVGPQSMKRIVN